MKAVIYSNRNDHAELMSIICKMPEWCPPHCEFIHLDDYDDLRRSLAADRPDFIIVYFDGAHGMEACIGIKKITPSTPLIWFSNDRGFGPQSYRLDCTFFGIKPASEERLQSAFQKLMMSQF